MIILFIFIIWLSLILIANGTSPTPYSRENAEGFLGENGMEKKK